MDGRQRAGMAFPAGDGTAPVVAALFGLRIGIHRVGNAGTHGIEESALMGRRLNGVCVKDHEAKTK